MSRVIGIDPGTVSFDLCGLENGRVFLDTTIPSAEIGANPQVLVDALKAAQPLDLVIGPSGYGLPWVSIEEFGEQELFLFILADERERNQISVLGGMAEMIGMLKASGLPIQFMPGVIHLPTVPEHRKANKIDMGTADKLCCLALGILDQARRHHIAYRETSFIFVEVGGAYTAVMAVQGGQVVDGLGGSSGGPGFYSLGAIDGELAYLLGSFPKSVLFSGGVAYAADQPAKSPEELLALQEISPTVGRAWEALFEGVTKSVAAEMTVVPRVREILLSGRLCRIPAIREELAERLSRFAPVHRISGIAHTAKEAAQGAALIADGVTGGQFADLVETMRLKEAKGTVLDYLHVSLTNELKQKYLKEDAR
ncbi:MAG: hypothetical protein BroJett011_07220 [Chloroflexota bacterium]|nr:MAG: hypothetical protein BroJett011_07220 [Chloroflexota bacterium]